ncbi:MAG: PD-(D/E)XK nuclease family transposase [Syntrophomonas sp.]|uniref:PD-(D/E)XK nuclease family transposase n=1 Tax=Syntrophomonas sp. TaxID=2053627 RepID=UPI0026035562|nr:PD-(D/E)XK nuclease family transposase [Syntrophomonas sp.]MDD4627714.1 PD-(D/E)XK nuclease family transposase [Syntrophomonas sp.]
MTEDETGYQLTDILEIHFLELPKLFDEAVEKDESEPLIQWMEFIDRRLHYWQVLQTVGYI